MRCDRCGADFSWHEWAQKPFCSPYCKNWKEETMEDVKRVRSNPERILKEYGAKELSKTREGVRVIERAASKYKKELLQPGHPDFNREWGKDVKAREEAHRDLRAESNRMWKDRGGREKLRESA